MLKIICQSCKNEIVINPYLYAQAIIVEEDPSLYQTTYTARVTGDYVCPCCGAQTTEKFECPILRSDIINLALRQNKHYDSSLVYKLEDIFGDDFIKSGDVELIKRGLEWAKEVEDKTEG